MSRFKVAIDLGAAFGASAPFPCPLGSGATFHILYAGSEEHRRRVLERAKASPVQIAVMTELFTQRAKPWRPRTAYAAGDRVKVKDDLFVCVTPGISGNAAAVWEKGEAEVIEDGGCAWSRIGDEETWETALGSALEKGRISVFDLLAVEQDTVNNALDLLAGWENVLDADADGQEIPFSRESAEELLRLVTPVRNGHPAAGKPIGQVYVEFINESARARAAFRGDALEAAGKNSPALTDGAA